MIIIRKMVAIKLILLVEESHIARLIDQKQKHIFSK